MDKLKLSKIKCVSVNAERLSVELEDGRVLSVPLSRYPRLAYATPEERANFRLVGAGYGIHWPEIDEDISVEGLLLGRGSSESRRSLARWLASRELTPVVE